MTCVRCDILQKTALLHSYQWIPPDFTDSGELFFNVAEIRLAMQALRIRQIEVEEFPYCEDLISLATAHDITQDHVFHIPVDKIRPSLVGNIHLPRKVTGQQELYSLMLDGHHSALRCIVEQRPIQLEIVPTWLIEKLIYRSADEMMNAPIMILEK